jgi:hypothetical protein
VGKCCDIPVFVEGKEFLLTLTHPSVMNSFTASGLSALLCSRAGEHRRKIKWKNPGMCSTESLQQGPAVRFVAAGKF